VTDQTQMAHALQLAARGLGSVWPNPAVGCVILQGALVVGRGWTQPGGRPHAEVMALAQAGELAQGATAYVTLEPCAHHGKTPPCADALIAAGASRVVSAITDPDPRVSGRGHAMLRAAGIAVTENVLQAEAAALNLGFFKRVQHGLPMITLKLAMSLDGRIANGAGVSRWITGPEARRATHAMRAEHDAVMVGIGTALADDPELTVRGMGISRQPSRIVLDTNLRLDPTSKLARSAREVPVWICHGPEADPKTAQRLTDLGIILIQCAAPAGHLDLADALKTLAARGLTRIFAEGGAAIAAALLSANLVDDLAVFSAGRLFGAGGTAAIGPLPATTTLPDLAEFKLHHSARHGDDLLHLWRRR
jgi:diaminohydroxyphosphoribosylaminopyrimidine deaminase/5-amino-6-(5-phosphoribosylamino)uracil reductase